MKTRTVLFSLRPCLFLMKIFGLFPFKLRHVPLKLSLKVKNCFLIFHYFVMMQCIPAGLIYLIMSNFELKTVNKKIVISNALWQIIAVLTSIIVSVQSVIQLFSCRKVIKIVDAIDRFDKKALKLGILVDLSGDRKKIFIFIGLIFLAPVCSVISYSTLILQPNSIQFYLKLLYRLNVCIHHGLLIGSLYAIQFVSFVWLTKKRFVVLNEYLRSRQKLDAHKIYGLYSDVTNSIAEINNSLTFNLNFTLLMSLVNVVFSIFSTTISLFHTKIFELYSIWGHLISNLAGITSNLILIISICSSGDSLTSAAKSNEETVLKMIYKWRDEMYNNELRCLLFQMKGHNKKIENIFFVINWKLVFMVSI